MALPTLSKTWQFNVNQAVAAQGTATATSQKLMRLYKNTLIGFGTNPWTVSLSSDSVTAGASDKWAADANLVWSTGNHSWIVLRQPGVAANYEICIDLNNATVTYGTIVVSPSAGFTGGTIGARPTATDELVLVTGASWGIQTTNVSYVLSAMQSSDGQNTRVMIHTAGTAAVGFFMAEKPVNPPTGWTNPSVTAFVGSPSATTQTLFTTLSSSPQLHSRYGASWYVPFLTGESQSGQALLPNGVLAVANDVDGQWPMFPIGLACATATFRGRHGTIADMWWGSSGANSGDTYPNDATNQFAQFGNIILPWNGTAVTLA